MYTPTKEKFSPPSPRISYTILHRIVPRHAKGYLWLCFLVLVFGSMLLSDNGLPIFAFLPSFGSSNFTAEASRSQFEHKDSAAASHTSDARVIAEFSTNSLPSASVDQHTVVTSSAPLYVSQPSPARTSSLDTIKYGTGPTAFTPEDVVILFKTGATTLWRRVPIHLATTLANTTMTPNVLFYSDQADHIAGRPIIDVLANVSDALKQSTDFELYRTLPKIQSQNQYLENAAMDGDLYLPGGWRLDKYKFLPLISHAATHHPGKKWYIYMEDDNYYFWHSLYTWLGNNFDPSKPLFLGSPAARLGEDFAHGGSGFIISGAAMALTFGADPDLAHKWEPYARDHCCGDQVLSHVMAVSGVPRDRRHDHTSFMGLQSLPTWRMAFGDWNWCSPLFNVHKVHQSDVSRLHVFENHSSHKKTMMTWGHLFTHLVASTSNLLLDETKDEWDNEAAEQWHASKLEEDEHLSASEKARKPWFSADSCKAACEDWERCLSWKYADDACGLASTVAAGRKVDAGIRVVSGFMRERIESLMRKECV